MFFSISIVGDIGSTGVQGVVGPQGGTVSEWSSSTNTFAPIFKHVTVDLNNETMTTLKFSTTAQDNLNKSSYLDTFTVGTTLYIRQENDNNRSFSYTIRGNSSEQVSNGEQVFVPQCTYIFT